MLGLLCILRFARIRHPREAALAVLQDALVIPERAPLFVPLITLATLYTLILTLLAVRSTPFTQTKRCSRCTALFWR